MRPQGAGVTGEPEKLTVQDGARPGLRGWLLVYMAVLVILFFHGIGLTVASIAIYADPSAAGLHSFVSLSSLLFYVGSNLVLAIYTVRLFVLMLRRRRTAIINNLLFNALSVVFLVSWHFLGEKSNVGTLVDTLPNLAGIAYILWSRRVRNTFIIGR
jgi:Protein of unknown function (DUF2569)